MILQRLIKLYILKYHNCRCLPAASFLVWARKGAKKPTRGGLLVSRTTKVAYLNSLRGAPPLAPSTLRSQLGGHVL